MCLFNFKKIAVTIPLIVAVITCCRMKKGFIIIDGFRLGYSIEGQGLPTLVIGSSVYYPRTFRGNLREHLQLIFIDHRGFVHPPHRPLTTADYDLPVLLADLEAMRQSLGLSQVIIMGHSGHAFIALEYAKKYPAYVSHVVMIGVSPDYSPATHQATQRFFEETASPVRKSALAASMAELPQKIKDFPERRFVSFCLSAGPQSWYAYNYDATELWEGVYTNMEIIDYVWGQVFRDLDITKGLQHFSVPVYLALGSYDFLTGPPTLWNSVRSAFQRLTIELYPQSSHTPQLEEAEAFNEQLLRWLLGSATPLPA